VPENIVESSNHSEKAVFEKIVTQRKSGFLRRTMVPLLVLGALVLEVEAIQDPQTQGHDYSLISTRNAFNLSNEPPPRKETAPPPEPPKNLELKFTGIFKKIYNFLYFFLSFFNSCHICKRSLTFSSFKHFGFTFSEAHRTRFSS